MTKYNVLLVDDEPGILSSLQRLLRNQGYNILTASSAEEALEIIGERTIQVLATDNLMPGMTGTELISEVKKISPDTIRLILSGHSDLDAVLKAVNEGGAFRFILKPWDDTDLLISISIALAHYKLADDNKRLLQQLLDKTRLLENIRETHPEFFDNLNNGRAYCLEEADDAFVASPECDIEE